MDPADLMTPHFVEVAKTDVMDVQSVHYDEILTDMSLAIQQEQDGFVADQMFNSVPTQVASAKFASYPPEYQLRHGFKERPDGTSSGEVTWKAKFDKSFSCTVYAAKMIIGKQLLANTTRPLDPQRDTLEVLVEHALIFKDEKWVDAYFKAGIWAKNLAGVTSAAFADPTTEIVYWSDYSNSDPIADVSLQKDEFRERTGKEINKMVIGRKVYTKLINHPKILARVINGFSNSGANPAKANLTTLASLFEVEKIVIANGIHDTGNEGQALAPSFIAGKHVLLAHVPARTNLKKPMSGANFCWTGYEPGVNNLGYVVDKWYERSIKSWIMEMELAFDMQVVAPSLGVFINGAIA